jgi:predicted membrane protein
MYQVTLFDRLTASSSAMAGALYVLAALGLWLVLVFRKQRPHNIKVSVILDRAIAWSALAAILLAIAAGRMRWVDWSSVAGIFLPATFAIMIAGLVSVRSITREKYGGRVLVVFVAVVVVTGLSVFLLG